MEKNSGEILLLPYTAQGHINPMLQFAKRLISKGFGVTLLTTLSSSKSMLTKPSQGEGKFGKIKVEIISDGSEEYHPGDTSQSLLDRFQSVVSKGLAQYLENVMMSPNPPKFLVYDSFMPWALDVATLFSLHKAPFFTQPCSLSSIIYHIFNGSLKIPPQIPSTTFTPVPLPSMPLLHVEDLPKYDYHPPSFQSILSFNIAQFSNFLHADFIFCNTFYKLEEEVIKWMESCQWKIKAVGPCIPAGYLGFKEEVEDREYGVSLFKPNEDANCIKWLDSKEPCSVIYASFGSLVFIGEDQMEEIAKALVSSNHNFLWVVRESEQSKLPPKYLDEISNMPEKGLVVTWCAQLEVLSHQAVGCFMTHCGWNSTMEALCLGVPMVGMPLWADQTTNAKFIQDVWNVGVRVKVDEHKGLFTREDIGLCISQIFQGEKRNEIKANSMRWKQLAKEAVHEGGNSYNNIDEFVAKLMSI